MVDISFDKLSYAEDDGELLNVLDSVVAYDIDDAVFNGSSFAVADISYSLDADVVDASSYAEDDGDWITAAVDDAYESSDVVDSGDEYDIDDVVVDKPVSYDCDDNGSGNIVDDECILFILFTLSIKLLSTVTSILNSSVLPRQEKYSFFILLSILIPTVIIETSNLSFNDNSVGDI